MMRFYYAVVYYLSWSIFGAVGLALNLVCAVLLLFPGSRQRRGRVVRRWIRTACDLWFRGMHAAGILRVTWHGFDQPLPRGTVIVANHPTLIDAILIMARVDDLICIFKPRLMRNPVIGPAAILAGYVAASGRIGLVREAAAAVRRGCSLLVFPEGTRTEPGTVLGPLKAGFALIARHAGAPVQYVRIRATPGLTARGRPWWKLPEQLPLFADVALDRRWGPGEQHDAETMTDNLREHILTSLRT